MEIKINYTDENNWTMPSHKNMDNIEETLQILKM